MSDREACETRRTIRCREEGDAGSRDGCGGLEGVGWRGGGGLARHNCHFRFTFGQVNMTSGNQSTTLVGVRFG